MYLPGTQDTIKCKDKRFYATDIHEKVIDHLLDRMFPACQVFVTDLKMEAAQIPQFPGS